MTKSIDFYFDFISPYSYLAHKKIINLNLRNIFNYKAILLGGLHNLVEMGKGDDTLQISDLDFWTNKDFKVKHVSDENVINTEQVLDIIGKTKNASVIKGGEGEDTITFTDFSDLIVLDDIYSNFFNSRINENISASNNPRFESIE